MQVRLSLNEFKGILNDEGILYTDDEVKIIVDFLYLMAQIGYDHYCKTKRNEMPEAKIVQIINVIDHEATTNTNEATSSTLHKSEYRRTG